MTEYNWDEEISSVVPSPMERLDDRSFFTYGGEIQMDKDITISTPELHERLGLDRKRWSIIGINASLQSGKELTTGRGVGDFITVYAVDRDQLPAEASKPGGLADGDGPIEVVEFRCHDLSFQEIMEGMKTVRISMMSKHLRDREVIVKRLSDIPVQDDH